jgi:uncharacterized protein YkwD
MTKALLLAIGLVACSPGAWAPPGEAGRHHVDKPRIPSTPVDYTTTPTHGGIQGGEPAENLAAKIRSHFGAIALQPDGRLANLATRVVWRMQGSLRAPDAVEVDALARELGIVGPTPFVFLVPYTSSGWQELEQQLAAVPNNLRFTHLGVAVMETGGELQAAVAVGAQHLVLDPIPRSVPVNGRLTFKGKIDREYREARWVWSPPDGSTRPLATAEGGAMSFTTEPLVAGVHRFQALGVGPAGLEVLANMPVTVGAAPGTRDVGEPPVDESDPGRALLTLVNHARARARARPLARTPVLDRIAQAHSDDMDAARFFGHESPTRGSPGDRMERSAVRLVQHGENVARASSASEAHRMLMNSPGHRQNLVDPRFTHVGIGIVSKPHERPPVLLVTQVFGRFPDVLTDAAAFANGLLQQINQSRAKGNHPPVSRARDLDAAAKVVATRLAADPSTPSQALERLVQPRNFPGLAGRKLEVLAVFPAVPEDIANATPLLDPKLRKLGIAVVQAEATADSPRTNVAAFFLSK